MGTYTELYIADFPVHTTKSAVDATVMTLFRESDKKVEDRAINLRNQLMWKSLSESNETELVVEYSSTVKRVIERLNILGFTLDASRAWFEIGVQEKLNTYLEWQKDSDTEWLEQEVKLLKGLSFESYINAFSEILKRKIPRWTDVDELPEGVSELVKYIYADQDYEMYFGFPAYDIRHFLRVALEVAPRDGLVIQDITDLVDSGYYELNDKVCDGAIDELIGDYLIDSKTLILTEGSSDKNILEPALELLYPHLAGYYSFMDFGVSKAAGGASALVTTIKAFIGAGIGNRVIALFDNDTAAKVAIKALNGIKIPNTIKVIHYPDVNLCENFPTLGPTGLLNVDINGSAGSIEVYLGRDVLENDGELTPVQWNGYDSSLKQYQGEILNKSSAHKRYFKKLDICKNDPSKIDETDWEEIRSIFKSIFTCFDANMPNKSPRSDIA